jgi:hypothetical protein
VDPEVKRVVSHVRRLVDEATTKVRSQDPQLKSVLVVDMHCDRAHACLRHLTSGQGGVGKFGPGDVPVLGIRHVDTMEIAGRYYRTDDHEEPHLDPGDVRVLVLTARTLSMLRCRADGSLSVCAPVYGAVEDNVLLLAVVAWRNEGPDGFLFKYIPTTRRQGDDFVLGVLERVGRMDRDGTAKEKVEAILAGVARHGRGLDVTVDQGMHRAAMVTWLEKRGHLVSDNFNGVDYHFGREEDLEHTGEIVMRLGG